MDATNYLEAALANHILRGISYTPPTLIEMALFTTMPGEDGTGGVEPAAASYARVEFGPSDTLWTDPASADGKTSNAFAVTFPSPTEDWGNVKGFGIYDEAGNLLILSELLTPKDVLAGNPAPEFNPGSMSVTFS